MVTLSSRLSVFDNLLCEIFVVVGFSQNFDDVFKANILSMLPLLFKDFHSTLIEHPLADLLFLDLNLYHNFVTKRSSFLIDKTERFLHLFDSAGVFYLDWDYKFEG